MRDLIEREPVAFQAVIQSALVMIMSFGVHLTIHQIGTILVFTSSVLALWTRQKVTPHPNNPAMQNGEEKP